MFNEEREVKRKTVFKHGLLDENLYRRLVDYLMNVLKVDYRRYICVKPRYVCFDDFCLAYCSIDCTQHVEPGRMVYSGAWIGLIKNNKIYLSTQLYEKTFREFGVRASIVVSDAGVRSFLYGRDVLKNSVVEKYPPLNNPVAVLDYADRRVIGVAEPYGSFYRNVYDVGLFLRYFG